MDFGFIARFSSFFRPNTVTPDDDFVDRLNHHVTVAILLLFMVMVSGKTYVGQPLQCAVPHHFNKPMEQYAENYCFVQNTYFIASGEEIPNSHSERDAREITYYQWVPFVLALQALMFYVPCLIWRSLNWKSGIHVASIAKLATQAQIVNMEERKAKVKAIVAHIYEGLHTQKDRSRSWTAKMKHEMAKYCCLIIGRKHGNYLSMLYLFTKFLYVVNVFGQFFLMNSFLSSKWTNFYGFQIATDVCSGHEWSTTGQFPRVTLCDFEMRVLGNVQRHTIQCVLMINMFNEKIYIFFWWWCFFMAVATTVSFIVCIFQTFVMSQRADFILQYLKMSKATKQLRRRDVEDFMNYHLQKDGVLLIRIIASGVGATVAFDVVEALWDGYQAKIHHASRTGSDAASSDRGSPSPPQYEPDQNRELVAD